MSAPFISGPISSWGKVIGDSVWDSSIGFFLLYDNMCSGERMRLFARTPRTKRGDIFTRAGNASSSLGELFTKHPAAPSSNTRYRRYSNTRCSRHVALIGHMPPAGEDALWAEGVERRGHIGAFCETFCRYCPLFIFRFGRRTP